MRIEALWKEIGESKDLPAFRRINNSHPLDIYLGVDADTRPILLLVSKQLAPGIGKFQAISLHRLKRDDGLWSYTFTLDDTKLLALFALLCEDLVATSEGLSQEMGTITFFARLNRWKALLANGSAGLSEQETRGLLAELYVLAELLSPVFGISASALGWSGPESEEQDFRISNRAFEVKSVSTGKTRVQIASLRQLDFLAGPLDLLVVPMNPASSGMGVSLANFVAAIRKQLCDSVDAATAFETKLLLAGYSQGDSAIERPYTIAAPSRYEVINGFPTFTPSSVPTGIVGAVYTIDLTFCRSFERPLPL
jgi:hypothetical protein